MGGDGSSTHLVPSLAVKLQPKVLLLHEVEVAAGEVEEPFPTGFLLANKHSTEAAGKAMLTAAMMGFRRDGQNFQLPSFTPFPDHAAAKSYSINDVGFSVYNRTTACYVLCF